MSPVIMPLPRRIRRLASAGWLPSRTSISFDVGGAEVGLRVPVRVAHQLDAAVGDPADRLALGVVLDHVRAAGHLELRVGGRVLGVVLPGVLARHGSGRGQDERRGRDAGGRALEVDLQRVVARRLDALDVLVGAGLLGLADDAVEVRRHVRVGDVLGERALERVLDVVRRDLAVDRRAELDAAADVDRDPLVAVGDLPRPGGQVGRRRLGRLVGLVRVQRPDRREVDHVVELVVRRARVGVGEVALVQDRELAAALGRRPSPAEPLSPPSSPPQATAPADRHNSAAASSTGRARMNRVLSDFRLGRLIGRCARRVRPAGRRPED